MTTTLLAVVQFTLPTLLRVFGLFSVLVIKPTLEHGTQTEETLHTLTYLNPCLHRIQHLARG